jgi:hypothetical protein
MRGGKPIANSSTLILNIRAAKKCPILLQALIHLDDASAGKQLHHQARRDDGRNTQLHQCAAVRRQNRGEDWRQLFGMDGQGGLPSRLQAVGDAIGQPFGAVVQGLCQAQRERVRIRIGVAVVALEEGARLISNVIGVHDFETLQIDQELQLVVEVEQGLAIPRFKSVCNSSTSENKWSAS